MLAPGSRRRRLGALLVALAGRIDRQPPPGPALGALKLRTIDTAMARFGFETFVDLGGVWGVDGGYSAHCLDRWDARSVTIVDDDFTPALVERASADARLRLVTGNFGRIDPAVVGPVDATIMFDVLLHQVDPDWDEVLARWAPTTRAFILAGPWYVAAERTVRLTSLSQEEYESSVPDEPLWREVWPILDEVNQRRGRPWRDVHDIWQWGIVESDLRAVMAEIGFVPAISEGCGSWRGLSRFENQSFVFVRPEMIGVGA